MLCFEEIDDEEDDDEEDDAFVLHGVFLCLVLSLLISESSDDDDEECRHGVFLCLRTLLMDLLALSDVSDDEDEIGDEDEEEDDEDPSAAKEEEQDVHGSDPPVEIEGRAGKFVEATTMIDRYQARPDYLELMCLAQFATSYIYMGKLPKKAKIIKDFDNDEFNCSRLKSGIK